MLIPLEKLINIVNSNNINICGVLHIGAHDCEEITAYENIAIGPNNIIWIDAYMPKVIECTNKGIPNVYNAVISDVDDMDVTFNVANNIQSSSILELGTHSFFHPSIVYTNKIKCKTITIDTFFEKNQLDASKYNFWNIDIQGAEMLALKGGLQSLKYVDIIYLEVNDSEVYRGCSLLEDIDEFLLSHGFTRVETKITSCTWGDAIYIRI